MDISPVIIVKDAARTIAKTLESLKEFDEVIVYDTGSSDETMDISRKYPNVRLCKGRFIGFGESKNKAARLAKYDWILSIDADEVISPQLMNAIRNLIPEENSIYRLKRYNYYRKRRIRFSGWGLEYVIRIYNKTNSSFNEKLVHEHIEIGKSNICTLEGELRHFSYSSVSDFIQKRDLYSELFAQENAGKRTSSPAKAMLHAVFDFFNTFLIKAAFLDGYRGLLIAVMNANVSFYKYLKLFEVNIRNDAKVSLIILLSNDCDTTIKRLLESALNQAIAPDEIIITANALSSETLEVINNYKKKSFIPIQLSWKDGGDESYIEPCSLAIGKAASEYLIFIEGNGVLHKDFVHDHLKYSKKGHYLQGSDMRLNQHLSDLLIHGKFKDWRFFSKFRYSSAFNSMLTAITNRFQSITAPSNISVNISFFKDEFFNKIETKTGIIDFEKFKIDLIKNLKYSGLKKRSLNFFGIHYIIPYTFNGNTKADRKKVLVCLDRLKHPNCGLGQVSKNIGRKLLETNTPELDFSFLLPASGSEEFENKIDTVNLIPHRNFFDGYMGKFDICHVTHQLPSFKFGAAKRNLITIHDLNFLFTKSKTKKKRYLKKLQRNIYKSDAIAFISEFTKKISYKNLDIPGNKIVRVIYNGVTAPGLHFEKPDWLGHKKFLFSIGQFLEKKNFHVLLPFIKLLPENIILVIAGENDTNYGTRMRQLVAEQNLKGRVFLPGGISELQKNYLYHHCEAFLFPSIAEGFGLPVIEAMLSNKPVFCSNRTSLEEIGGAFAFFWTDFDPENMLKIFNYGLEKFNNEEFKQHQREYAKTFTHEKNTQEYLKLYKELVKM